MNNNLKVGNLFGIPFLINPSWFLVFGLVTLSYGGSLSSFPELNGVMPWLLGLVTALLLFSSVLAHELGHSVVAISQGIKVNSITLFIFGGLASLEKESEKPWQQFLIAIAGPAVSLVLWAVLMVTGFTVAMPGPISGILFSIATVNLFLGLFNLIPGLPLDGGNIVKALVWQITGNRNQGTIFASRAGQVVGGAAIAVGLLGILNILPLGNFWTLLVGWFILQNAGASAQSAQVQETLTQYTAQDAVIKDSPIVAGDLNLREFANNYIIGQKPWQKYLVVDANQTLLGAIEVKDLKAIPTTTWPEITVQALTKPVPETSLITANQTLLQVAERLETMNLKELAVISEDNILLGLLEKPAIISLLKEKYKLANQA
ncbi:MAG: site-2 protease family protein [Synechococcaceae cyanobacterium RL_1_2]|nr:site-2 protease family protein [Synechococcaceae cyanobacterium RL_1_2]